MASSDIIKDIAQQIASRRALYDGAYRGGCTCLRSAETLFHGKQ